METRLLYSLLGLVGLSGLASGWDRGTSSAESADQELVSGN